MGRLVAMWVAVAFAAVACTAQWQYLKEPTIWEQACADVEVVDCGEQVSPEIVNDSWLIQELTGAMGVFVAPEWRIYMAPVQWILMNGYSYEQVLYHESTHAVYSLLGEDAPGRCESERLARKATDAKFGTHTADNGWEEWYGCTNATPWRLGGPV